MAVTEYYLVPDGGSGGGSGTEGDPWTTWDEGATGWNALTIGDGSVRLNIKSSGDTTPGAALTLSLSADATHSVHIRGYGSTIGDHTKAVIDMEGNKLTFSGASVMIEDLDITGSDAADNIVDVTGDNCLVYHCKCAQTNGGAGAGSALQIYLGASTALECAISSAATGGYAVALYDGQLIGCRVVASGSGLHGVYCYGNARSNAVCNCVISGSGTGYGIHSKYADTTEKALVCGNTIYNFTNAAYIENMPHIGESLYHLFINNVCYNVTNGLANAEEGTIDTTAWAVNNAISATTDEYQFGEQPVPGAITLTASPFVDTTDFKLNTTAGGGAACRAAACPTDPDQDGTVENFLDVGALQHEDTGGGGGTSGMAPYWRGMHRV